MVYNNLKNSTIIIPTYKRYPYLLRLLKFYESYKLDIKIIVLDSTPDEHLNKELTKLLSNKNILWIKFDSEISFWDKISEGVQYIDSEFVTLCADDDFIIPGAIVECINFLDRNSDYVSAHGLYFNHLIDEYFCGSILTINPIYNHGSSSDKETGVERVQDYLNGKTIYYPFYAVHRTSIFKLIWTESKQYVSAWGLGEIFPSAVSLAYGKMMILKIFYVSREPNNFNWIDDEKLNEIYSEQKIERLILGLKKHLCIVDNLSTVESENVSRKAIQSYMNNMRLKKNKQKNNLVSPKLILNLIYIKQKIRLRTRIKNFINFLHYEGCHPDIYEQASNDYCKVKNAVLTSKLSFEELNVSRSDY